MWKLKNAFIPLLVGLSVSALLYYLVRWWGFLIIFPWIGLSVTTGALLRELLVGKQRLFRTKGYIINDFTMPASVCAYCK